MDPPLLRGQPPRSRFPRPRGDGPRYRRSEAEQALVSPPTRGWTLIQHPQVSMPRGFPAHAGMDRRCTPAAPPASRFPRPRGDGPLRKAELALADVVSPPTRGWTLDDSVQRLVTVGFPAHAGMDLSVAVDLYQRAGFPRPRGDGPGANVSMLTRDRVSPPTRGWTPVPVRQRADRGGFPAHAGMDLKGGGLHTYCNRFPRPRGDGPPNTYLLDYLTKVSPPTRGWTRRVGRQQRRGHGFPAHAGMDRRRC